MATGKGLVCKLGTHIPIEGADKIVRVDMFGETIITQKTNKEGELGILFDMETCLSHEYSSKNNMYRHSQLNVDESEVGYLEDDRRIRPIKLKGVKVSGLWMPLSSLEFRSTDTGKYPLVGFEVDSFDGVPLCEKYVSKATRSAMNSGGGKKVSYNAVPTFKEHIDTEQWARNKHVVKNGSYVILTEKLHGTCMLPSQRVLMADGSYKQISTIKEGDYVLGFDHNLNYTVPSKVLKIWNHGKNEDTWQLVKYSRDGLLGNSYGSIYCTKEHEFYVNDKYLPAKDIKTGDILTILRTDYELEDFQKQVLIGKFLGDGSIKIRNHSLSGKMTFGHSEKQLDYLEYCNKCLSNISYIEDKVYVSGYGSKMYRCHTKDTAYISEYFSQFIVDGRRKLNDSIVKDLNPIALAFLYMDDGSISDIKTQNYRADLALCNFDKESCEIIQKGLLKFGINSTLYNSSGYRIRMNFKDASIFYNLIAPYVPISMQYKLPESLRGFSPYIPKSINKLTTYVFKSKVIDSIDTKEKSIRNMSSKIDITTETSNFFAGDVLVHNSGRAAYLPTLQPKLTRWQNIVSTVSAFLQYGTWNLGQADMYDYEFVVGSRRVVKSVGGSEAENKNHFYKEDLWTTISRQYFGGRLKKGESVYFEIVGYTPTGEAIMASTSNTKLEKFLDKAEYKDFINRYGTTTHFHYGCSPDGVDSLRYKVFVYRITMANEDGDSIDYTWDQVKSRCDMLGVDHVPELDRFEVRKNDIDLEEASRIVEELTNKPSEMFPGHVREGICIRVDTGSMTPTLLKNKSYVFKVLEGIIKDSDKVDIEESN